MVRGSFGHGVSAVLPVGGQHSGHSPNLPYSKGMGSHAAAIRFLKVVQREKLNRGKLQCTAGAFFKDHNTKPVWISCAFLKMYGHGGFDRCSSCTLEFPSAELFPLHNFQQADCRCQPVSLLLWSRGGLVNDSGSCCTAVLLYCCITVQPFVQLLQSRRQLWRRYSGYSGLEEPCTALN